LPDRYCIECGYDSAVDAVGSMSILRWEGPGQMRRNLALSFDSLDWVSYVIRLRHLLLLKILPTSHAVPEPMPRFSALTVEVD
jgi:hypothetical protein